MVLNAGGLRTSVSAAVAAPASSAAVSSSSCAFHSASAASATGPIVSDQQAAGQFGAVPSMRGGGGRSSNSGLTVAVFGCTGQLGRVVVNELGRTGSTVIIPSRGDDCEWRHLKVMGDYGKIVPRYFELRDAASVAAAVDGADVVVNLIGKHYETKHALPWWINYTLDQVHNEGARAVAEAAKACPTVKHFVHVSALAQDADSPSEWAASKARGEAAVRAAWGDSATIVRPADLFGPDDRLINHYAVAAKAFPVLPLANGGTAKLQPVYARDVAEVIRRCVELPRFLSGRTVELAGPEVMTERALVDFVLETIRESTKVIDLPQKLAEHAGFAAQHTPNPMLTRDQVKLRALDNVLAAEAEEGVVRFEHLAMTPTEMREVAVPFLIRYKSESHFADMPGSSRDDFLLEREQQQKQ